MCLGKDTAFIQMKYVATTVISMFIFLRHAVGTPQLIHCLNALMKGGFLVVVEKRRCGAMESISLK